MWSLFETMGGRRARPNLMARLRSTKIVAYSLARQCQELNLVKRERWLEADLEALPREEPDMFDRKSGRILENLDKFLPPLAKALSAFANSGGGSLIIGVEDSGGIDGVPSHVGSTTIRDWIEQKIPHLLDYPLSDFRVHTVEKDQPSKIPEGREVIVIDVGDSASAPHQSKKDHIYYQRMGGRSVPAAHFYLELLRQRLTNASLEFSLHGLVHLSSVEHAGGIFSEFGVKFRVLNIGRVACYDWGVVVKNWSRNDELVPPERVADYFPVRPYPASKGRMTGIPSTRTILPGCSFIDTYEFGVQLRPTSRTPEAVAEEIGLLLKNVSFGFQLATETSPGEIVQIEIASVVSPEQLSEAIQKDCLSFFHI